MNQDKEKDDKEYTPNEVPLWDRLKNIFFSAFFIIYGGYGLWVNDIAFSRRRRFNYDPDAPRREIHFHDEAAIVLYIGLVFVSICFISEVIDHYDKRNNEHVYHKIANYTLWPGVALCILAIFLR